MHPSLQGQETHKPNVATEAKLVVRLGMMRLGPGEAQRSPTHGEKMGLRSGARVGAKDNTRLHGVENVAKETVREEDRVVKYVHPKLMEVRTQL